MMKKGVGYRWHLRSKMDEHGMFATTTLGPLLAERGITLSREQVYRLTAGTPQRLSLHTLAALCDIFNCTPSDLIEPTTQTNPHTTNTLPAKPPPDIPRSAHRPSNNTKQTTIKPYHGQVR